MFIISCFVMVAYVHSSVCICLTWLSKLLLLSSLSPYGVCHLILICVIHTMGSMYSFVWQFHNGWCLLYVCHEINLEWRGNYSCKVCVLPCIITGWDFSLLPMLAFPWYMLM
jgi:hypothetical protein